MASGKPPAPGERPQANGLRLFVSGPDGDVQLDDVNPNITARELANEFMESRYGSLRWGRLMVDRECGDLAVELAPRQTLEQSGVADGDRLHIRYGGTLAAGPFELVVAFVAGAVASGVLGNASYDLLKEALGRLRKRFSSAKDAGLSDQDVADIAVGCCCIKLKIEDITKVIAYDAWIDAHNIGIYPPPVPDRMIGNAILYTSRGTVFAIILPAADGDPDGLQIELQIPKLFRFPPDTIDE
jgi:hypothetical protein